MDEVRLPDLEVIRRFSIAVRREHASVEEVLEALTTDLEALRRAGARPSRATEPATRPERSAAQRAPKPAPKPARATPKRAVRKAPSRQARKPARPRTSARGQRKRARRR